VCANLVDRHVVHVIVHGDSSESLNMDADINANVNHVNQLNVQNDATGDTSKNISTDASESAGANLAALSVVQRNADMVTSRNTATTVDVCVNVDHVKRLNVQEYVIGDTSENTTSMDAESDADARNANQLIAHVIATGDTRKSIDINA